MPKTSFGRPPGLPLNPFLKRPAASLFSGFSFFSLDAEVAVFSGDEVGDAARRARAKSVCLNANRPLAIFKIPLPKYL
jgi:hypothetical protein